MIAAHDPTEDIDKDSRDLGIARDEIERVLDGGWCGSTAHIQEVSWLSAVELDDVHCCHGESGSIDETSDIAVELDEVESVFCGFDFVGVFLRCIPCSENVLLPEVCVVVEAEFGIHTEDLVIRRLRPRVNLNLRSILLIEQLIQLLHLARRRLNALLAEAQLSHNLLRQIICNALVDIHGVRLDCARVRLGNFLDIHASLRGSDDDGALTGAVHEDGEVEFAAGELAFDDVDGVAGTAGGTGLFRDELVADHFFGESAGFGGPGGRGRLE